VNTESHLLIIIIHVQVMILSYTFASSYL